MKKIALYLLALGCTSAVLAQQQPGGSTYYYDAKGIVYQKELTFDLEFLQTNGYALGVNIGKLKTYYLTNFYNIEIGEIKHTREYRQSFDFPAPSSNRVSRAFIFGKQNNFIVLRGGLGQKRYFSEKAKRKGLAVGISYEGGPSLGLLKPYYLELVRTSEPGGNDYFIRSEKYSAGNEDLFLDITRIFGASGFSKGLGEVKVLPGGHAKMAVHFDWGAFDEFVKALEAGVMIDFYFRDVPIMVESPQVPNVNNSPIFVNLYLNLQLGKRW